MISSSFSIDEFMEKVKDHSYLQIIQEADQEATEAERLICRCCQSSCGPLAGYACCLKDFILYMRHGVRTRRTRHLNLSAFQKTRLDH